MTGRLLESADVPVTKGSAGLVVLPPQSFEEQNCIRCGACARVCPSRLMPFAIDAAVVAGKMDVCADYGAVQCISCGCCSFICPARRYLATRVTLSRNTLRRRAAAAPSPKVTDLKPTLSQSAPIYAGAHHLRHHARRLDRPHPPPSSRRCMCSAPAPCSCLPSPWRRPPPRSGSAWRCAGEANSTGAPWLPAPFSPSPCRPAPLVGRGGGGVFAVAVVKEAFGGIGHNLFNPAMAARGLLLVAFPTLLTGYARPDAVSSATPLSGIGAPGGPAEWLPMLTGTENGSMGKPRRCCFSWAGRISCCGGHPPAPSHDLPRRLRRGDVDIRGITARLPATSSPSSFRAG